MGKLESEQLTHSDMIWTDEMACWLQMGQKEAVFVGNAAREYAQHWTHPTALSKWMASRGASRAASDGVSLA